MTTEQPISRSNITYGKLSARSTRSQESGDNVGGRTKDHVYEGFVFDSGVKHTERDGSHEGTLAIKRRHLVVGVVILLIVMIAMNIVCGYVVFNMSKCQECQPQPEIHQQTHVDPIELYATYIRWGRTICPNESTTVYTGYASGSHYQNTGSTSHTICLPQYPQYDKTFSGEGEYSSFIYNAEYEIRPQTEAIFGEDMHNQDVPCAVCEVKGKSAILMIPARMECYDGWTKEYSGYLMTDHHSHQRSSMKCVDENPEKIRGQSGDANGDLFYFVKAEGTIPDPPYTRGAELTCVVCTK